MNNKAGISSFRGFLFQIDVFISYLVELSVDESLEYETIEDVVYTQNIQMDKIEHGKIMIGSKDKTVIQVKSNKSLSKDERLKVLYNWMLIPSELNVKEYILYMENPVNEPLEQYLFLDSPEELYQEIELSQKKSNALISQMKAKYISEESFKNKINNIKKFAKIKDGSDIEDYVFRVYSEKLHRYVIEPETYFNRLERLKNIIHQNIREQIKRRKSYICTYNEFYTYIEQIIRKISDEQNIPSYTLFETTITDKELINLKESRAYRQLLSCEIINETAIRGHMIEMLYYRKYRNDLLTRLKNTEIKDIEKMGYGHHQMTKRELQYRKIDTPFERYITTMKKDIKVLTDLNPNHSVYLYLTNEWAEKDVQISWKDEENE